MFIVADLVTLTKKKQQKKTILTTNEAKLCVVIRWHANDNNHVT